MEALNRRNTEAAEQSLRSMDQALREQEKRIDGLMNSMSGLHARINGLERLVALQHANMLGHGPTVK